MSPIRMSGLIMCLALLLSGCSTIGGIFGGDGDDDRFAPKTTAIGVNGYLWTATLETLSFMPIASADTSAAAIITDWHSAPETPQERIRVTVRFLSQALRSDGLAVTVIRQVNQNGNWVNAPVQAATALRVEEAILTAARRLRVERLGDDNL